MGMQGNLHDMSVADLIQQFCQDRKTARLLIQNTKTKTYFFFKEGALVHAQSDQMKGEDVVFKTLGINEGQFSLDLGIEPPELTITRSWSGLLLEGARRLDETPNPREPVLTPTYHPQHLSEEKTMSQKIDELLTELSGEINGYVASSVVGMDGMSIATHSNAKIDKDTVSAQLTLLMKLVDTTVKNFGQLTLEDSLTTTEKHYFIMRYLPGNEYFLSVIVDRKNSSLGNLRLLTKLFSEKISHAIPHS